MLVFGIAVAKASMVMRDYMHLKFETLIIHVIALIPILLIIGLALTRIPISRYIVRWLFSRFVFAPLWLRGPGNLSGAGPSAR